MPSFSSHLLPLGTSKYKHYMVDFDGQETFSARENSCINSQNSASDFRNQDNPNKSSF